MAELVRLAAAITPSILGKARVVVVKGSAASATVVDCRSIDLADPALPESYQPYYGETGALRKKGPELERLIASVERFGRQSVIDMIDRYQATGHSLVGVAIILGSLAHPDRVDDARMRGYALEQQLFRRVIEAATAERLVPSFIFHGRDLFSLSRIVERERFLLPATPAMPVMRVLPDLPVLAVLRRIAGIRRHRLSICEVGGALAAWFVLNDWRNVMG